LLLLALRAENRFLFGEICLVRLRLLLFSQSLLLGSSGRRLGIAGLVPFVDRGANARCGACPTNDGGD
jgi:hypothetical protein